MRLELPQREMLKKAIRSLLKKIIAERIFQLIKVVKFFPTSERIFLSSRGNCSPVATLLLDKMKKSHQKCLNNLYFFVSCYAFIQRSNYFCCLWSFSTKLRIKRNLQYLCWSRQRTCESSSTGESAHDDAGIKGGREKMRTQ